MAVVSLIVATRDRLRLLQGAVGSVEAQTFTGWELIVVDDASVDGTDEWLRAHADERVRHLRLDVHRERSAARNQGLAAASGEYVLFLDDDDRLLPEALDRLVEAARLHPDAVAVMGGYTISDGSGNSRRAATTRRRITRSFWPDAMFVEGVNLVGRTIVRTDVLRRLGGFVESLTFAEDWELWLRVTRLGDVVSIPDVVFDYRLAPRSLATHDTRDRMRRIIDEHVRTLDASDRRIAERVIRLRERYAEAMDSLSALDAAHALRGFASAIATHPGALRSPLMRPPLLRGVAKAAIGVMIGRRGVLIVRRIAAFARRARGRDAWSTIQHSDATDQDVC